MKLFAALLDLLYPPRCAFCCRLWEGGPPRICPDCLKNLPLIPENSERRGKRFSRCVAPLRYEGAVRDSLLRYKFSGLPGYAETYGPLLADCIQDRLTGEFDRVTWVPLSRKRLRQRGYDQARLLAEAAAAALKTEAVPLLEKVRDVKKQSKSSSAAERRTNIAGAYRVLNSEEIKRTRVLLIDDIITTGATMEECAGVLRRAGAAKVVCAALAMVQN